MENLLARTHNPDVLTCIANLSNDEVFTPPEKASAMLDMVADAWAADHDGASLWANPDATFLDPFTKTGVFLREITRRLVEGLEEQIPDLQERVNHVLTKQVFGIAITELTALMARRSVYCSKRADSEHSICTGFNAPHGNIWFERTEHTWAGGTRESRVDPLSGDEIFVYTNRKCSYCGASESAYGRGEDLETHAYAFIHTDDIKQRVNEIFGADMHFDIVIGNPPYQISDGGHEKSARPIYHMFVEQALALDASYMTMIIPARWFAGGKGLNEFRARMLEDSGIRELHDYPDTEDVFPGVNVRGGICYFLYDSSHTGETRVVTHQSGFADSVAKRPLLEEGASTFVRYNEGIEILRQVQAVEMRDHGRFESFETLVSSRKPFGIPTNEKGAAHHGNGMLKLHTKDGLAYIAKDKVTDKLNLVQAIKILVPYASPGNDSYPHLVLSKPIITHPGEVGTETYLAIGPFDSERIARNVATYMGTTFFRFMLSLLRVSQHVTRGVYHFVPLLDTSIAWTDELLVERYRLSGNQIDYMKRFVKDVAWRGDFE